MDNRSWLSRWCLLLEGGDEDEDDEIESVFEESTVVSIEAVEVDVDVGDRRSSSLWRDNEANNTKRRRQTATKTSLRCGLSDHQRRSIVLYE